MLDHYIDRITGVYLNTTIEAFIHRGTPDDRLICLAWFLSRAAYSEEQLLQILDHGDAVEMERLIRLYAAALPNALLTKQIDSLYDHTKAQIRAGEITSNLSLMVRHGRLIAYLVLALSLLFLAALWVVL